MTQSFDDWFELHQKEVFKNGQGCFDGGYKLGAKIAYKAGAASRQAEIDNLEVEIKETQAFLNNQNHIKQTRIDELQKRIDVFEKHVTVIKNIHENEFNEDSDTSWILGNLDGFFECLNEDLKGNKDD